MFGSEREKSPPPMAVIFSYASIFFLYTPQPFASFAPLFTP